MSTNIADQVEEFKYLVGVVDHDKDDDIETVEKEVVNHLKVGGLGYHLPDTGLHVGHHQHAGDRHHHSVLPIHNADNIE